MYEVNGVDLTSGEYRLLRELAGSDDRKALARSLLDSDPARYNELLRALRDKGMVRGTPLMGYFDLDDLTDAGESFLGDLRIKTRREWARAYLPSIIAALLGVGGTLLGVLLGWLLGSS